MPLTADLVSYSNAVLSGKIVSGQKHKQSCTRFLRDLRDADDNSADFPFFFNEKKADRFIRYCRFFEHTKGVLKGKRFDPALIFKFVFGNIYGWEHKETHFRRFNKAYWQVARKNMKSQACTFVGAYELMAFDETGVEVNEVYVAATKSEQAKIVYGEACNVLRRCKLLKGKYKIAYGRIEHLKSGSIMRPLSEEDRKTGDGLNPQCGIIDEYHAHETSEILDVIDSGMGAREQPLLIIITTAGFNLNCPCYQTEYKLVSKILDPDNPARIDNYFVMVNELDRNETGEHLVVNGRKVPPGELIDDINDEVAWEKANPVICSYDVGKDYLRKKLKEANEAPEKMRNFLTKHMNVWVDQKSAGYLPLSRWAACGSSKGNVFPDVVGMTPFLGVDLSSTIDLTSVSFVFPLDNCRYSVLSHSFIPEERINQKRKTDKMPYDLWVRQGWITATEGSEVDYHEVLAYIDAQYADNKWQIGEFCFDRALATWLKQEAERKGFTPVDIPQTFSHLSNPTKDFRAKVLNCKIIHNNNPVLTWAMGNAVTRTGPSENILLDKSRSSDRIDPLAATINAFYRASANEKTDSYNTREMRGF